MTVTIKKALTVPQEQATVLIAAGMMKKDVAEQVGVSPQSISAWMQLPSFVAKINQERETQIEVVRDSLRALGIEAAQAIREVLQDKQHSSTRLRAAEMVLKFFADKESALNPH